MALGVTEDSVAEADAWTNTKPSGTHTMKREFYLQDGRSNKFWTVEVDGATVITSNGRVGAKPRETRKAHADPGKAMAAAERDIVGKLRKGYVEGRLDELPPYQRGLPPKLIRINHDDYHARYVGKTKAGDQFFLTHPFAPAMGDDPGGSYVALYVFDAFGTLIQANIRTSPSTRTEEDSLVDSLLQGLGEYRFADIRVSPFSTLAFGRTFGLIFDPGEDEDDDGDCWVTVEPGNYMAFYPPWDGDYDT